MLEPGRGVVLVDFGDRPRADRARRGTGEIGTPGFMAPEVRGRRGRRRAPTSTGCARRCGRCSPGARRGSARRRGLPGARRSSSAALRAGLEMDPRERIESMEAFAAAIGGELPRGRARGLERWSPATPRRGAAGGRAHDGRGVRRRGHVGRVLAAAGQIVFRRRGAPAPTRSSACGCRGARASAAASLRRQAELVPDCRNDPTAPPASPPTPATCRHAARRPDAAARPARSACSRSSTGATARLRRARLQRAALFADLIVTVLGPGDDDGSGSGR